MSLAQLPSSTVKLITSTQIITSVSSAVKELIENSLDAGASSVDVKLVNNGLDRLEVKDNGSGINKVDTAFVALPHYTSKISDFKDLESLSSYGFRGEALNALCQVAQVTLTTATSSDSMATTYTLDSSGNISETKPSHHVQGTTVVALNLFKNLPVRRQVMGSSKRAQEELKQVETVVKSLSVIKPEIRLTLSHNKCLIWQKTPCSSLRNSFSQLIGYPICQQLEQLSFRSTNEVFVEMLVPKRDCEISNLIRSTPSFSLVFINQRPVTYKKLLKILHQQLTACFKNAFPSRKFAVSLFSLASPPSSVDVNLEPNKTKVLLKDEDEILGEIEKQLVAYYSSIQHCVFEDISVARESSKQPLLGAVDTSSDLDDNGPFKRRKLNDGLEDDHTAILSSVRVDDYTKSPLRCDEQEMSLCLSNMTVQHQPFHLSKASAVIEIGSSTSETSKGPYLSVNEGKNFENESSLPGNNNPNNFAPTDHTDSELFSEKTISTSTMEICEEACNEGKSSACHESVGEAPLPADIENLWDNIDDSNLNGLTECLDALEKIPRPEEPRNCESLGTTINDLAPISSEAWSMGHITTPHGNLVMGSAVLIDAKENPSNDTQNHKINALADKNSSYNIGQEEKSILPAVSSSPSKVQMTCLEVNEAHETNFERQKHPQSRSPEESTRVPTGNGPSPGLDYSLQSVSSQMGRRELAAFTKFAREVRPQIILENPGIAFTHVATKLADKWTSLPDKDKEYYEEVARESATTRKVWKTLDKQKKLEWIKKLPEKFEKKKILPHSKMKRVFKKEVSFTISLETVQAKCSGKTSKRKGDNQSASSPYFYLIGQLEPSGTWVYVEDCKLGLLNHSRLQEVVINHRLLNTHALKLKPLPSLQLLDAKILGEEDWITLVSLPCSFDKIKQSMGISADVIIKNGFKIEIREEYKSAVLLEVAEALNYYGIRELKETLSLCRAWSPDELSRCRPLRVINHIKSEAMRICRQSPSMLERTMVEELVDYWRTFLKPVSANDCLHSKPIFNPIFILLKST